MLILLFHIETIKVRHGDEPVTWINFYESMGNIVVSLFFVLSGFLITFLLLKEKQETGNIKLKNYYVRRALKILPLYYVIMIIGFFVLPLLPFYGEYSLGLDSHYFKALLAYLLFVPPVLIMGAGLPEAISPTWTVRVEEAFYFFWPMIVRRSQSFLRTCFIIIIATIAIREGTELAAYMLKGNYYYYIRLNGLALIFSEYRISCMALGGIAAYLFVNNNEKALSYLYRKNVQVIVYLVLAVIFLTKTSIPFINNEFYSVLFAFLVLNLATNPHSVIKLKAKWMAYLGSLSYGLYLYHPIMRILSLEVIKRVFNSEVAGWQMQVLYYSMTISTTILISMLSYKLLEKPFLNLKKRFSFIYS